MQNFKRISDEAARNHLVICYDNKNNNEIHRARADIYVTYKSVIHSGNFCLWNIIKKIYTRSSFITSLLCIIIVLIVDTRP